MFMVGRSSLRFFSAHIWLPVSLVLLSSFFPRNAHAAINLVQHVAKDAGSTTSASLSFTGANVAGNWIAVCVRAGKSGQTFSIKDSLGNVYKRAVQLNVTTDAPNGDTVGIFYA